MFLWPVPPQLHPAPALAPHLGAISGLNVRLLYTPTHNAWGLAGKSLRYYTPLYRCVYRTEKVDLCKKVKIVLVNTTVSFCYDLYVLHATCIAHRSTIIVLTSDHLLCSLFSCLCLLLRQNILQMDLRWATAPSISSTGWTDALWLWGWLISCLPVCPLSTCTTIQTLPHCLWAPTLLSGWFPGLRQATSSLLRCFRSRLNLNIIDDNGDE